MDAVITGLAQVEVEEVYVAEDMRCDEPLDCMGCGLCSPRVED